MAPFSRTSRAANQLNCEIYVMDELVRLESLTYV